MKKPKHFTLIELLVVIAIIAILAAATNPVDFGNCAVESGLYSSGTTVVTMASIRYVNSLLAAAPL